VTAYFMQPALCELQVALHYQQPAVGLVQDVLHDADNDCTCFEMAAGPQNQAVFLLAGQGPRTCRRGHRLEVIAENFAEVEMSRSCIVPAV
jgi:hypothetical protein